MPEVQIQPVQPEELDWVLEFISKNWGAPKIIVHDRVYLPHKLPGLVARIAGERVGLLTYEITGQACEVVTLDSLRPREGVASALIQAVAEIARQAGCSRLWLITTNDNLTALRFYQKRGFVLVAFHREAVNRARRLKPEIPQFGEDGIPIRDEIELELTLIKT